MFKKKIIDILETDPDAQEDCKNCGGSGQQDISGNMCFGFGAQPKMVECWCVTYKQMGRNWKGGKDCIII